MDRWKHFFRLLINAPANDAHLRSISKAPGLTFNLVLLVRSVKEMLALSTQLHEFMGASPASLAGLDVMDIEHFVFRLALTPLTHMTISCKDVFPDIPETEL